MQCPNCGKDALNVNGRYVCLDCGIEITPQEQASPEPAVPEATTQTNDIPTAQPTEAPSEDSVSAPADTTPTVDKTTDDVSIDGIAPSGAASDQAPAPETSYMDPGVSEEPMATPPVENPAEPVKPVEDEFKAELTKPQGDSQFTSAPSEEGAQVPDFPNAAPTPAEPPKAETPAALDLDAPSAPEVPQDPPTPQDYFQPATVDIAQNATPAEPQSEPETKPEPAPDFPTPTTENPAPAAPETQGTPSETTPAKEMFSENKSDLDGLLNQYAGAPEPNTPSQPYPNTPTPAPPPVSANMDSLSAGPTVEPPAQPSENNTPNANMPGTANIPSADSVFGPSAAPPSEPPVKKNNKRLIILIASIVLGVLILAGAIFFIVSLSKSKNSGNQTEIERQQETIKFSKLVGDAMDPSQNEVVTFEQNLDFSQVTVKESAGAATASQDAIKTFVKTPLTFSGNWKGNTAGNVALEGTLGSAAEKRTYIAAEKSTYVFAADTGKWTKTDGIMFPTIPPFYGVENKGGLFYTSKNDDIVYLNDEELDGKTYQKIQLNPKKEVFEALIANANPLFAKIKIDDVNTDNIDVFAWITPEGKILKVSVAGDLGITSDLFEGTVTIKSEATYEYKDVTITKPQV